MMTRREQALLNGWFCGWQSDRNRFFGCVIDACLDTTFDDVVKNPNK